MTGNPGSEAARSWRLRRDNLVVKMEILLLLIGFAAVCKLAEAQTACSPPSKLYCIVPNQLGTASSEFTALNEAVGTVVSDLPLASPASGVIYKIDPRFKLDVPVEDTTLGPVLTQRPETIGRHKTYVSIVYQYFSFSEVDGRDLRYVPSVTKTSDLAFVTTNALGLWVHQISGYFTFGLTNRIDVSAAVPILDVHEAFTSRGSKIILSGSSTPPTPIYVLSSGSTTGIGDVVLAVKGTIWKSERFNVAEGLEVRLPTGDAENFLGSGTLGVKPYLSAAFGKRLTVHGDFGYQVNGDTKLVTNSSGGRGQLPNRMFESAGIDWGARKWITLVADILAERVFNSDRIAIGAAAVNADYFPTIVAPSPVNSYNRTDGALGAKLRFRNFMATMNVTERLDQGGLRSRIIPLGGVSYTF
jgi:hypothetical protein